MRCVVPLPAPSCGSSCDASFRPSSCLIASFRLASSRLIVSSCDASERGGLVPCRRVSSVVSFPHSSLLVVFARLRSSSWAWACGEIELTKTARFAACRLSSHPVACVRRGDMGIGPGRTIVRRGTVAGLFRTPGLPYMPASRFRKTIPPPPLPAHPTPRGRGTI